MRKNARLGPKEVWEQFSENKELLAKNQVTPEELKFLKTVELFGSFKAVDDILLVLRNIR